MRVNERSAYGQGIIASKQNWDLKDNPFETETVGGILKRTLWASGFNDCENNRWGDIKRHGPYENLTSKGVLNVPASE